MGKSHKQLPKPMKGVSGDKAITDPVLQFDPHACSILPASERIRQPKVQLSWDEFMDKQRQRELDDPDSLAAMASYRHQLDQARDQKLSAGQNHADLRKGIKKKKKKKKDKKKHKKNSKHASSENDSDADAAGQQRSKTTDQGPVRLSSFMNQAD
eukprot:TRINITY_DN1661_c0_g1_i1.p2 TRINITY_DN1661_c0_g1~~TRINITY_DN1661_c0_g1_i1.p2  ORF type:complete len:155 (-),score=50.38 TRINITY_DN1661_c0_g1_i1:241-705(-)